MDTVWVRCILREDLQVLDLLYLDHLAERVTDLVIFASDRLIFIQSFDSSPLFLKEHVHLTNSIDRIGLLPYQLQISLLLHLRQRVT